ncbi:hypothetical protein [Streptomyces noursei]|uniref:LysM domain-containing protein n=1 Tax=Streptomyces noursei TaxID=1971 RepID=A0A2N8PFS7_STRNR|nr:hypothetical protein [Streptomyces noursei]PNE39878.1 hypothetical protein AOB60_01785 [Streptomyces noursei]
MAPTAGPLPSAGALLRALVATVTLLTLVAGVPYLLLALGHPPTELPTRLRLLTEQDNGTRLLVVLAFIGWAAWAAFTLSVMVELVTLTRRRSAPHIKGLGGLQSLAGTLIGGIVLLAPTEAAAASLATAAAVVTHPTTRETAKDTAAADTEKPTGPQHTIVSSHETLWDIAALNATTHPDLTCGNAPLKQGWELALPPDTTVHTELASATVANNHDEEKQQPTTYTVRTGASLSYIGYEQLGDANRWSDLYKAGKDQIHDPDLICLYPGQHLGFPQQEATPTPPQQHHKPAPDHAAGPHHAQSTPVPRPSTEHTAPAPAPAAAANPKPEKTEGPALLLLGPVSLETATDRIDSNRVALSTELAAYLNPDIDHHGIDNAPWPTSRVGKGMRTAVVSRQRMWLGQDTNGRHYLPPLQDTNGHCYRLNAVNCDWSRFQQHTRAGLNHTTEDGTLALRRALALVRGRPVSAVAPQRYSWAEPVMQEMREAIVDTALELSDRFREAGGPHRCTAAGAARRGRAPRPASSSCAAPAPSASPPHHRPERRRPLLPDYRDLHGHRLMHRLHKRSCSRWPFPCPQPAPMTCADTSTIKTYSCHVNQVIESSGAISCADTSSPGVWSCPCGWSCDCCAHQAVLAVRGLLLAPAARHVLVDGSEHQMAPGGLGGLPILYIGALRIGM